MRKNPFHFSELLILRILLFIFEVTFSPSLRSAYILLLFLDVRGTETDFRAAKTKMEAVEHTKNSEVHILRTVSSG